MILRAKENHKSYKMTTLDDRNLLNCVPLKMKLKFSKEKGLYSRVFLRKERKGTSEAWLPWFVSKAPLTERTCQQPTVVSRRVFNSLQANVPLACPAPQMGLSEVSLHKAAADEIL